MSREVTTIAFDKQEVEDMIQRKIAPRKGKFFQGTNDIIVEVE